MRQGSVVVMNAVIRLIEQSVRKHPSKPASRHNRAGGTVHGIAHQTDVFDVLAPGLEISRDECWEQKHPEKILPYVKPREGGKDDSPAHRSYRQLPPYSSSYFATAD